MNRSLRESLIGGALNHRRGHSLNGLPNSHESPDDNLDLFSRSRRSLSLAPADVSAKLGRLSFGSKQGKSGLDDLLSSPDGGKHDYDWLLTPPGTPLVPSSNGNDCKTGPIAPKSGSLAKSTSATKASRLSVSHSENNRAAKPTRSSSATRPSVSSSQYSTYSNKSSILNTSSGSVSSYIRPSTPTNRSSSTRRPSTPSARPSISRSTTPSKPHPVISTSVSDKPRPSPNSRPSTPTSRSQSSANLNSPSTRTASRPSTPTRRNSTPSLSPVSGSSTPVGRSLNNGRTVASVSRPSSPGSRIRPPPQPISLPDYPLDTPPNLRTSLPDRPISAGRSRPSSSHAATNKGNSELVSNTNTVSRRHSSPVVTRGRLLEPSGRGRTLVNGHSDDIVDSKKELSTRKTVKASAESTGFGRTISKKSLDMAIRHMDIRNGSNGLRSSFTGSNLFPQSIRSTNQKIQAGVASVNGSVSTSSSGTLAENRNWLSENGNEEDKSQSSAKLTNDIYESSRYDMIILKEDLKNTNWLHSFDEKLNQGSVFDNGFEFLPEPFDPL